MKITIDTKEDSSQDIRKVIALLSKMIEDSSENHSNIFEDDSPGLGSSEPETPSSNAFSNMFGSSDSDNTPVLPTSSASEDGDEEETEEETEEEAPQIMEY